ncbi:MAG: trehalose-6-phosphate synthase [Dehalococcoidales bacterium]|nr:trehalose-6-phosphate synthase [Dehalococcoidales bacterium]
MWDTASLFQLVHSRLTDYLIIVVSNREPYIHSFSEGGIKVEKPPSGLTVALDPIMQASGGIWIAHGSGDADQAVVDRNNRVDVPPDRPRYALKRVWLSREEEEGYYYGFANEALWPLCHIVYNRPVFRQSDWETYVKVNRIFAQSVLDEINGKKAFVFIQDYHLALVAKMIREQNPDIITAHFWHIPWPNPEVFRICPWQNEILEGLLSNDLFGFHIRFHCNNFMDTVARALEARVDYERYEITYNSHKTAVSPFPISVDFEDFSLRAQSRETENEIARLRKLLNLKEEAIGIGIERFDYTKGIPDRIKAIDRFLDKNPRYREKMVFIQAGVASRTHIEAYKNLNREVETLVQDINTRYGTEDWKPIILMHENLPQLTLLALRKMADFCIVSALHDGMNLVAKEFVASRYDEDGVLILSTFTGSARELSDALLVNPFATELFADAILAALEMPGDERKKRMQRMRNIVREHNIYKWAGDIITDLVKFEFGS